MIYLIFYHSTNYAKINPEIQKRATSYLMLDGRVAGSHMWLVETEAATAQWRDWLKAFMTNEDTLLIMRGHDNRSGWVSTSVWTQLKLWRVEGAFGTAAERKAVKQTQAAAAELAKGPPPPLPESARDEIRELCRLGFSDDEIADMAPTFGVDPRSIKADLDRWHKWTEQAEASK